MALQDDLLKLVQKASIDGSLTPVAVEYTQKLIAENAALVSRRDTADAELAATKKALATAADNNANWASRLQELEKREAAVAAREKNMTRLELVAEHHQQRVADHKDMFALVFRNIQTRRNVFTGIAPAHPSPSNQYPAPGFVQENQQTELAE